VLLKHQFFWRSFTVPDTEVAPFSNKCEVFLKFFTACIYFGTLGHEVSRAYGLLEKLRAL